MFESLFGAEMPLLMRFFIAFLVVLGLIAVTAWVVRRFGAERLGAATARGRQPRLAVIDAAAVDGRRRLILIRRDNVEHLLMIGGPSDVVIEPNIVRAAAATREQPARCPGRSRSATSAHGRYNRSPHPLRVHSARPLPRKRCNGRPNQNCRHRLLCPHRRRRGANRGLPIRWRGWRRSLRVRPSRHHRAFR
jgi:Flagellar biosynthesis protein, FliO